MRFQKEEFAAFALLAMALVGVFGVYAHRFDDRFTDRYLPGYGLLLGLFLIGCAVRSLRKGAIGKSERNGRAQRPYVFWPAVTAFLIIGVSYTAVDLIRVLS